MASKQVKVILKPGHEVVLQSDAPDIGELVNAIVTIKDNFIPGELSIECEYDGFDKASFREVVIEATNDFIEAMRLDKQAFKDALAALQSQSQHTNANTQDGQEE